MSRIVGLSVEAVCLTQGAVWAAVGISNNGRGVPPLSAVLLCLAFTLSLSGWLHQRLNDRLPGLIAKIILDEKRVSSLYRNFGIVLIHRLRAMPFSLAGSQADRLLSREINTYTSLKRLFY